MLHHEESPEKPCYNVATPPSLDNFLPPFCLTPPPPPFLAKSSDPPISINFGKVNFPSLKERGVQTMLTSIILYKNKNHKLHSRDRDFKV